MPTAEVFRVNYYVGAMLAQGGNVWVDDSRIVFSPTSAIDRAMGAKNVEIPFQHIHGLDSSDGLARTLRIKTEDKVHKFEGTSVLRFRELLEKKLPNKSVIAASPAAVKTAPAPQRSAAGLACDQCTKPLQPGYFFCPHCGNRLKTVCHSCQRVMDPSWSACAFCGRRLLSKAA